MLAALTGGLRAEDAPGVHTASLLTSYAAYVNGQIDRMSAIHRQVEGFNLLLLEYQSGTAGIPRFKEPVSPEEMRFFKENGEKLRGQMAGLTQVEGNVFVEQFDQLQRIWDRMAQICRDLESFTNSGAGFDEARSSACYERIRALSVLFEDYSTLKARLYFALKHPVGQQAAVGSAVYEEAVSALAALVASGESLHQVARSGHDLTRAQQRLHTEIGKAETTYERVRLPITREYAAGVGMMTAYQGVLGRAKALNGAATASRAGEELPEAYLAFGKAYHDANLQFWPLLYQAGTGMVHQFNLFSESQRNLIAPLLASPPWLKPLMPEPKMAALSSADAESNAAAEAQRPNHLILLFDNSGSMQSPEKLALFQQTFRQLMKVLPERDRLSVVTFGGDARLLISATSPTDHQSALRKVGQLTCSGNSPILEGIDYAYLEARTPQYPDENKRIVMITDGGFAIPPELPAQVEEKAGQRISLSIFYVGKDDQHARRRLSRLAEIGKGTYSHLRSPEQLTSRFYPQPGEQQQP